jgi:Tfp pilus assembly protein PilZ
MKVLNIKTNKEFDVIDDLKLAQKLVDDPDFEIKDISDEEKKLIKFPVISKSTPVGERLMEEGPELAAAKQQATELGITFAANIGLNTLKKRIEEKLNGQNI